MVQQALRNNSWVKHIYRLETGTEIREISLLEHSPEMDKIIWRWTSDEEYTTNSAYSYRSGDTAIHHLNLESKGGTKVQILCMSVVTSEDTNSKQLGKKRLSMQIMQQCTRNSYTSL